MTEPMIAVENLGKSFTLHTQGGVTLPVFQDLGFRIGAGECMVLDGPSGAGKSTLLRLLYGNYLAGAGRIFVRHGTETIDLAGAPPHVILDIRRRTIGYVSQFLRCIPCVPAIDVVREPLAALGIGEEEGRERAARLLARLNIPERMWSLAPAMFSGGEQQRVNVARVFVVDYPILLLDEPTASLDAGNRSIVVELILEAKARGGAVVGIFHDADIREAVGDRMFPVAAYGAAA